ncbi:MAG: hypothetical protein QXN23_05835 [Candidatus Caldarchaeum sp.]
MSYNVVSKLIVGDSSNIASKVSDYLNTVLSTKVIRGITMCETGNGRIYVLIIHDA